MLTREHQRQLTANRLMMAVNLECHLRNLLREILDDTIGRADKTAKIVKFQQAIQYAPAKMKATLLDLLSR